MVTSWYSNVHNFVTLLILFTLVSSINAATELVFLVCVPQNPMHP